LYGGQNDDKGSSLARHGRSVDHTTVILNDLFTGSRANALTGIFRTGMQAPEDLNDLVACVGSNRMPLSLNKIL
jgi:hypothetical protein